MKRLRWVSRILSRNGSPRRPALKDRWRGFQDIQQFQLTLRRERARTDRSGDAFSLVTFTPRERQTADRTLDFLAASLKRRLRITDQAGWLSEAVVGVFLPSTPAQGAWKVADDVCLAFPATLAPPACAVYGYPSDFGGEDERRAGGLRRRTDEGKPVGAMEHLFAQRLPAWKRLSDIAGSLFGIIVLSPLLLLIAVAVKLTSRGPVLFRQKRSGLGDREFVLYKFRSMIDAAEAMQKELWELSEQDGPAFKMSDDPRTTPLGRFLRSTSLDELPQLWNVLRGDMSLVGPRPLPCPESEACLGWQKRRLDVTPGLTCTWQVFGRSRVPFVEWMRMDLRYAERRSLIGDLRLMFQTLPAVFRRDGN
jgi:lipopolysaccharide/colanic/teichoic acid biosynthesis glycosyltransferase